MAMSNWKKKIASEKVNAWMWLLCVIFIVFSSILVGTIYRQTEKVISVEQQIGQLNERLATVEATTEHFRHYGIFTRQPQTNNAALPPKMK